MVIFRVLNCKCSCFIGFCSFDRFVVWVLVVVRYKIRSVEYLGRNVYSVVVMCFEDFDLEFELMYGIEDVGFVECMFI